MRKCLTRRQIIISLTLLFIVLFANAQYPTCGFQETISKQMLNDSLLLQRISETDRILNQLNGVKPYSLNTRNDKVIPVVIHVVWNQPSESISDEIILSQIEQLNLDFNGENSDLNKVPIDFEPYVAKDGIRFCLATLSPDGKPSSGVIRKKTMIKAIGTKAALYYSDSGGSDTWPTEKYLNIWLADTGDFITGFGTYPGQVKPERQGIVINPKYFGKNNSNRYNLGRVAVHEIGHYLGLNHTWDDNSNCDNDDGVLDTPLQNRFYEGCPNYPQFSCGSADMFMNFMDYVNDDCMFLFTQGQMDRMKTTLEVLRPGLLSTEMPCIDLSDNEVLSDFYIYPNPNNGVFTIDFPIDVFQLGNIKIFNAIGQLVYEKRMIVRNNLLIHTTINISGIYYVKVDQLVVKMIID